MKQYKSLLLSYNVEGFQCHSYATFISCLSSCFHLYEYLLILLFMWMFLPATSQRLLIALTSLQFSCWLSGFYLFL